VDLSVRLVQSDRRAAKYAGLVNAVLRRCAREGAGIIDEVKSDTLDLPPWLMKRWIAHYGETTATAMALALSHEPSLDLTVKSEPEQWASRLHGEMLPTGTVRTLLQGPVTMLPGFSDGQWWVQDAAAALPARLFGDVAGKRIADLWAARALPRSTDRRPAWRGCATI
jgi:16S rRNA (cytosine967-C5)-methyltransferase